MENLRFASYFVYWRDAWVWVHIFFWHEICKIEDSHFCSLASLLILSESQFIFILSIEKHKHKYVHTFVRPAKFIYCQVRHECQAFTLWNVTESEWSVRETHLFQYTIKWSFTASPLSPPVLYTSNPIANPQCGPDLKLITRPGHTFLFRIRTNRHIMDTMYNKHKYFLQWCAPRLRVSNAFIWLTVLTSHITLLVCFFISAVAAYVLYGYTHRDVKTFFCLLGGKLKAFAHRTHKQYKHVRTVPALWNFLKK